jgi:uncharacterized radical SAM superfamily protein
MKSLLLLLIFQCLGCVPITNKVDSSSKPSKYIKNQNTIYIDFQGGFLNDTISIFENDVKILTDVISTNEVLGFAYRYEFFMKDTINNLTVALFHNNKKFRLDLTSFSTNYVGVWFDEEFGLRFHFFDKPFLYE